MQQTDTWFQYYAFGLGRFIDGVLKSKRVEIFERFLEEMQPTPNDRILDVGVSKDEHPASNMFEKLYPYPNRITAVGLENLQELEQSYPGLTYVQADGRALPFADGAFDYVYSHAVIEHCGSREAQLQFVAELCRVAAKGVFVTTPNRHHPLEFHTGIPLVHFLPHRAYRRIYRVLGRSFYAREDNLNLLSARDLRALASKAHKPGFKLDLKYTRFALFRANLLLIVRNGPREVRPHRPND